MPTVSQSPRHTQNWLMDTEEVTKQSANLAIKHGGHIALIAHWQGTSLMIYVSVDLRQEHERFRGIDLNGT